MAKSLYQKDMTKQKSNEALKREFKEEINADIVVSDLLDVAENIFTYEGKDAHELIFIYSVDIKDCDYKEEYSIIDETDSIAKWIDISKFKNKEAILYPVEILKYL